MATRKTSTTSRRSRTPRRQSKASRHTPVKASSVSTYNSAVRYLLERTDLERVRSVRYNEDTFKLDRMASLLDAMGNPEKSVPVAHVAGTVGKGSTVAMISSILRQGDFTVGTFTSPHLTDIRERIAINGQMIEKSAFTSLTADIGKIAEKSSPEATYFELLTAMALEHFASQAVDIAVMETGLGGRLDATNLTQPNICLLTLIDYDHMNLLGNDLESIAAEKAGIMKPGVPVISVPQTAAVEAVLRKVAEDVGTTINFIGREIDFSSRFCVSDDLGPHTRICLITDRTQYMHLPVPLPGAHQANNCALALAAVDAISGDSNTVDESIIYQGLAETVIPGRMERIWDKPAIIADGAHNPAALECLMRTIGAHVPNDSMICVFGCCQDKDVDGLLDKVALGGDKIIFTKASNQPRAIEPEELVRRFAERHNRVCQAEGKLSSALEIAAQAASRDDLICVTGSFFLVGEAKRHLSELAAAREAELVTT
ncbi:MAG: bifunctional folylpolyglutamate synthase/dihydrofolate synthase [Phycisphaerales bacterium]|nr:bifunctional folylpolyglutamate synthase/dihydrofolate synthase [Phycisphaerales bacterium]